MDRSRGIIPIVFLARNCGRDVLRSLCKTERNSLMVVDELLLQSNKTKDSKKYFPVWDLRARCWWWIRAINKNLRLSSRNLPKVKLVPGTGVNIFDVVNSNVLLFSRESILQMQEY